jgi:hypothetical protein
MARVGASATVPATTTPSGRMSAPVRATPGGPGWSARCQHRPADQHRGIGEVERRPRPQRDEVDHRASGQPVGEVPRGAAEGEAQADGSTDALRLRRHDQCGASEGGDPDEDRPPERQGDGVPPPIARPREARPSPVDANAADADQTSHQRLRALVAHDRDGGRREEEHARSHRPIVSHRGRHHRAYGQ